MHYFAFNIGDYASHTHHLDLMEDLAYRRLLDLYYLHERPLNASVTSVARQIGMRAYEKEVQTILSEFFELTEDGWINTRADKEIATYHSKIQQASRAGKASAERRSNARSTDVQPTNNHKPININQEPSFGAVAPAKKASRMTEDWQLPKAWGEWAVAEHNLSADTVRLEASKFRDYWLAKAGKDGAKLDWSATWRNWVRNSLDFSPVAKPGYQTQGDRNQDVLQGLTRGLVGGGNVKLLGN